MTLEQAMRLVVGKNGTQKQLGDALGCIQSAIAQWDKNKIPWARELQVNDIVRKQKEKKEKAKAKKEKLC